jgi:hypothetical protein
MHQLTQKLKEGRMQVMEAHFIVQVQEYTFYIITI